MFGRPSLEQQRSRRTAEPLTGKRFGRLLVQGRDTTRSGRYLCLCDCGRQKPVAASSLRSGDTSSCGCLRTEMLVARSVRHGASKTRTYVIWENMVHRCTNERATSYARYGAMGIRVCERWLKFLGFLGDMGHVPEGKTLDRIDNSKGYEPGNCRWATVHEQANNKGDNRRVEWRGRTFTVAQLAAHCGVNASRLYRRLDAGWPMEQVVDPTNFMRGRPR